MKDFGGMVSFRVAGGADAAMRLTTTTQVFSSPNRSVRSSP